MKLTSKFLLGLATVAFAACSSDEPAQNPTTPETPDGEVAYMAITITSAQTDMKTRATTDGGYEESDKTPLEHEVKSVQFLFFDKDGAYAFTAKADDATLKPADNDATNAGDGNIEYIGDKNILILNGVRANNYPEYVITVLNAPADFTPGMTMQETADKLATYANDFATTRQAPFVMTTSSFYGDKTVANNVVRHDAKYYATRLHRNDFKTTEALARNEENPVEIYVERLAAKVELNLGGTTETIGGVKYYKLNQTLAGGDDNTGGTGDDQSDVDLYVKVVGWRLNATANNSYMSKKLDSNWATTDVFEGWNVADDWRSYWAQSYTYGPYDQSKLTYQTPQEVVTNKLGFTSQDEGNVQYCYENTNAPANIFAAVDGGSLTYNGEPSAVENKKVTHVVLHTQVYQKNSDGTMSAASLVQYRGLLFTEASFKALLLNNLKATDKLNFWLADGTVTNPDGSTTANYKSIDASYLLVQRDNSEGHKLGEVEVVAKNLAEGVGVYKKNADGSHTAYTEADYKQALNDLLAAQLATNVAVGCDDSGDAFYFIPVEHLAAKSTEKNAVEGYYGVVRNHWYRLTVNSFKKVGHLVFDPETDSETPIIPEGPEDPLYYVGANVKILSWKIVNQSVDL